MPRLATNYNLEVLHPELAKQWHPTKNGDLKPTDVTPGSVKKVWWLCPRNPNHDWPATVASRSNGTGCPYCSGKRKITKEWLDPFIQ